MHGLTERDVWHRLYGQHYNWHASRVPFYDGRHISILKKK